MRYQPIDATLHGATDYTVGSALMTVGPKLAGVEGTRSASQIRLAGALHAGYSALTDYPLGAVKAIPYKAHLALDAIGAIALAATPFITGQYKEGRRQWVPHVALALFELGSLAMSDPSGRGSSHSNVDAVREANDEDPRKKIYEGPPAVRVAS
jgi:hypothetical protein